MNVLKAPFNTRYETAPFSKIRNIDFIPAFASTPSIITFSRIEIVLKIVIVSTLICCVFEKFLAGVRISLADKEIPIESHHQPTGSLWCQHYCQYQQTTGNITEY